MIKFSGISHAGGTPFQVGDYIPISANWIELGVEWNGTTHQVRFDIAGAWGDWITDDEINTSMNTILLGRPSSSFVSHVDYIAGTPFAGN
jgi:hypothetical protein